MQITVSNHEDRVIRWIVDSVRTLEGAGFEVRRCLPRGSTESLGPFIFFDHFGPNDLRPGEAKGAPSHPHAGIETVSYLLEGRAQHKDSLGNASEMGPGEVQWMRAGKGVVHDERPSDEINIAGGRMHGLQLWINIPADRKQDEPAYRHFSASDIPTVEVPAQGVFRVIAGQFLGKTGPVETYSSPLLVHATLNAGEGLEIPAEVAEELGIYVIAGKITIGSKTITDGTLVSLDSSMSAQLDALSSQCDVVIFGGDAIRERLVRYGPFVMNTEAQIEQAILNFQAGRMGSV